MKATAQLVRAREHLEPHRRLITVRAVAATLVGSVPIPGLDDHLASAVRRGTMRKLADLRNVDLAEPAVAALADGEHNAPPTLRILAKTAALRWIIQKAWRKTMLLVFVAQRADAVGRDFLVFTLFDHYCARLHVGGAIEPDAARELRRHIDSVISDHRARFLSDTVTRGLRRLGRRLLSMPQELFELVVKMVRNDRPVDDVVSQVAADGGFLSDAARAIEVEVDADGWDFLGEVIGDFDRRVRSSRR